MTEAPITFREALRLLLDADSYPRLGNHDWREADLLEAEALKMATTAEPRADDPPEFAHWLIALRDPQLPNDERGDITAAVRDLFEPESQ